MCVCMCVALRIHRSAMDGKMYALCRKNVFASYDERRTMERAFHMLATFSIKKWMNYSLIWFVCGAFACVTASPLPFRSLFFWTFFSYFFFCPMCAHFVFLNLYETFHIKEGVLLLSNTTMFACKAYQKPLHRKLLCWFLLCFFSLIHISNSFCFVFSALKFRFSFMKLRCF